MTAPNPPEPAEFHERLTAAGWIRASAIGMGGGFGLAVARIDGRAALITFALTSALLLGLLARWTPTVAVRDTVFVAGRAQIGADLLRDVEVLDAAQLRHAHGPGLDVRAYLCLRGWIHTGVRVSLADPSDPTPYWLVSSRRAPELAAALRRAIEAAAPRRPTQPG